MSLKSNAIRVALKKLLTETFKFSTFWVGLILFIFDLIWTYIGTPTSNMIKAKSKQGRASIKQTQLAKVKAVKDSWQGQPNKVFSYFKERNRHMRNRDEIY